ncbi:MAG TPA: TonB family protein [Gammaproteobacteria bacterium]|jgi:TonB family protein|nr:TonB family protein [Gammaproteobacteria bacterium]
MRFKWTSIAITIASFTCLFAGCATNTCEATQGKVREFQLKMQAAIDSNKFYPKEAVTERVQGTVTMSFDYINGNKAQNVHVEKSSGSIYLDSAALIAVLQANLPPKPCGMEDIKHFVFTENFSF